jgi:hypothetical protein
MMGRIGSGMFSGKLQPQCNRDMTDQFMLQKYVANIAINEILVLPNMEAVTQQVHNSCDRSWIWNITGKMDV